MQYTPVIGIPNKDNNKDNKDNNKDGEIKIKKIKESVNIR